MDCIYVSIVWKFKNWTITFLTKDLEMLLMSTGYNVMWRRFVSTLNLTFAQNTEYLIGRYVKIKYRETCSFLLLIRCQAKFWRVISYSLSEQMKTHTQAYIYIYIYIYEKITENRRSILKANTYNNWHYCLKAKILFEAKFKHLLTYNLQISILKASGMILIKHSIIIG